MVGLWVVGSLFVNGATANGQALTADPPQLPAKAEGDLDQLITKLVLDSIPHTFTEKKKWGMQDERFDGFKRERDGLKF